MVSPHKSERIQRIEQMHCSEEYLQSCQHFHLQCDRITRIAKQLLARVPHLQAECERQTARRELASGSTLHRGVHCPSPVFDLIVGNTKRGKILKRPNRRSKPSHEYGFNQNGQLLWCKTITNSDKYTMEYIIHEGNAIYGIMMDRSGHPETITEEIYADGKIISYMYGLLCVDFCDGVRCTEVTYECYGYDADGLRTCEMHHYMQTPGCISEYADASITSLLSHPLYRCDQYLFERKDGRLSSYTGNNGYTYQVRIQRKA